MASQVMMPPGSLATTDDIVRLCEVVARHHGIYSTHIRNEGTGVFASVKEAIEIGERAGVPVDVIHLKIADQKFWGRMSELVSLIEDARRRQVNVQANVYPYTRGNNNLVSIIPPWAHEGGRDRLLERLNDPAQREKIKHDILGEIPGWYNHFTAVGQDWSRILVSGNNRFAGLAMDRVMSLRTQSKPDADLLDELFDFLLEEDGSVGAVYAHHTEEDMNLALRQPWCSRGNRGQRQLLWSQKCQIVHGPRASRPRVSAIRCGRDARGPTSALKADGIKLTPAAHFSQPPNEDDYHRTF